MANFKPLVLLLFLLAVRSFDNCAFGQTKELNQLRSELTLTRGSAGRVRLMNKIGFLIHMTSADSCFYYGIKANQLAEELHDKRGKADALTNIGIGFSLKGIYSESLAYYSKAYQEYAMLGDTIEMSQILMNSAISYSFTSDSTKTGEFAKRALVLAIRSKADSAKSMIYANYADLGGLKPAEAVIYLDKAENIARRFHDDRTLLYIKQQHAKLLLDKKQFKDARKLILSSIALAAKHQWEYHLLEGLSVYGDYFMAINRVDSALRCFKEIYSVGDKNNFVYWKIDILRSILKVYQRQHDLRKQAETNLLLVAALDKQNENNNSFFGDYIKYSAKDAKLAKLTRLDNVNNKKQTGFLIVSTIGCSITLLLLYGYFISKKQERALKLMNLQIINQNVILQKNDEFNNRLLSMMAHDFRAPLGQMLGMVSILREEELDRETRLKFYDSVESDVQNILVTFDNILQWIKKQLSGYQLIQEELNVCEMLVQAAEFFHQQIKSKAILLNNLLDPQLTIMGDREILQFINRNLIHNAIKYSPANGIITFNVKAVDDEITVCIRNEGKGMTRGQLDELFSFRDGDSNEKGAGMALTLSREFISLLDGKIWAESMLNESTTFCYALSGAGTKPT